jgi:acetolactate synthase-1/2/3 large subunit
MPETASDYVSLSAVVAHVARVLPQDGVVCTGAGNYTLWVNRYFPFRAYGTQIAPTCGFMGYGVPAAVAVKRCAPQRTVVVFAGDGCFLMNGQEFATAVHYNLPLIVLVVDNGMYGTIRMHQERSYPGRICGTILSNPDFAALARAFGGYGERVEKTEDFGPSFARALSSGKPALLHVLVDPNQITPNTTLSASCGM